MGSGLLKQAIESSLPNGSAWNPAPGEGMDQLYDGMADNMEILRLEMEKLAHVRDPNLTDVLSDLEREFGFVTDTRLTESIRRQKLASFVYRDPGTGSEDDLQTRLQDSGFDLQVHQNDPAVDPAIFLEQDFQVVMGGGSAYMGRADAFMGQSGGELLANGPITTPSPAYTASMGSSSAFMGNATMTMGGFSQFDQIPVIYPTPTDPNAWPFIFFVGGDATRDPITGALTEILYGNVPSERKQEFQDIVLKIKPLYTMAGLIINYT